MAALLIRTARVDEAAAIAEFHAEIWRQTYRDTAPAEALETLDAAHRLGSWQTYLDRPKPRQHTLLVMDGTTIAGLVHFGAATDPVFGTRGEIKHLYIDPTYQRQGLGKRLLIAAFSQMLQDGFSAAGLAVFSENPNALKFYTALGGPDLEIGKSADWLGPDSCTVNQVPRGLARRVGSALVGSSGHGCLGYFARISLRTSP